MKQLYKMKKYESSALWCNELLYLALLLSLLVRDLLPKGLGRKLDTIFFNFSAAAAFGVATLGITPLTSNVGRGG